MFGIVDTHCHIDLDAYDRDRADVIARAAEAGVDRLILIGFEPERWEAGRALAATTPGISLALGLHPTEAGRYDQDLEDALRRMVQETGAIAIGETGLDYHWTTASPGDQRVAFERQIALAKSLDLPFIVHQRDSAEDALMILREADPPHRGVMHCFTGGPEYADACLTLGLHLGIGGAVTFRNARALQEAVARVPLDRIVLETDSPYMAPAPYRGKRNEPAYLIKVLERVAQLRNEPVEQVAAQTTRNAEALFRLSSASLARASAARARSGRGV